MSRALKIKHAAMPNTSNVVTAVTFTSFGSYLSAATIAISPPPFGGEPATATAYIGATTTSFNPTGVATVAYLISQPWYAPTTPGALSPAKYVIPGGAVPGGLQINDVTGTSGEVQFFSPQSWIQAESVSITFGSIGGLVAGQTYYFLASGSGLNAQLTDSYANAVAGISGLTTTVASGSATFSKGAVSGIPFQFNLDTGNRGEYLTAPTGPYAVNISGGGQGLTIASLNWGLTSAIVVEGGSGYTSPPVVTVSSGAAVANATVASASTPSGLIDIGYNQFSYLTDPVPPTGMTAIQYLGVVGGGAVDGGVATTVNPTVKATAWIPGATSEDDVFIVTQKGATRFQVAGKTTAAASTMVAGQTYIIASAGDTLWSNFGASTNANIGDVFTATGAGSGTGTVAFAGTCSLANQAPGSVTVGNMQITVTVNSVARRASRISNKYVWDYTVPQAVRYASNFFAGSAATVNTAKSGAQPTTFVNGTGNLVLGQVTNYTS